MVQIKVNGGQFVVVAVLLVAVLLVAASLLYLI
jgi:hypothetical protein